jgi:hypothetical protein
MARRLTAVVFPGDERQPLGDPPASRGVPHRRVRVGDPEEAISVLPLEGEMHSAPARADAGEAGDGDVQLGEAVPQVVSE